MSAVWSPLVRTRFATDNVEVAHDLTARMYANHTLHASGGNGSFRLEMSGVGTTDLRVDRLRYGVACSGVLGPVGYLLFHTTIAGRYQMTTAGADVRYSRGMPGLIPLGIEVGFGWGPDYEVRVLPLRLDLVAEHAAAMAGIAAADELLRAGVRAVFGIDRGVDLSGGEVLVAEEDLHDVRREAAVQRLGGEYAAEVVIGEGDRLTVDGQAGPVGEPAEQADQRGRGDRPQLGPVEPADQVRQRGTQCVFAGIPALSERHRRLRAWGHGQVAREW